MYRGLLTEESLDKAGRLKRRHFGAADHERIRTSLSYDLLDPELLANAVRMGAVYTAIHSFENMVRQLVSKAMAEQHGEQWWERVPERIRTRVSTRMEDDAKTRWHGSRGIVPVTYCDFGDLSSIIVTNWTVFEALLGNME